MQNLQEKRKANKKVTNELNSILAKGDNNERNQEFFHVNTSNKLTKQGRFPKKNDENIHYLRLFIQLSKISFYFYIIFKKSEKKLQ